MIGTRDRPLPTSCLTSVRAATASRDTGSIRWRPARRPALAAALCVAIALAVAACGHAINFNDPEGPRYYDPHRSANPPGADSDVLRLVTFNIELGREIDGAIRLIRTTELLRDPDLLLLQEMSGAGVARIAESLGLNYLYFPSGIHPKAHQEYGTAILSPWPIEDPSKLLLPYGAIVTGMRRAVTAATVQWRGRAVRVFSVHLPAHRAVSEDRRREQVGLILEGARRDPGPVVVAGDFNSPDIDALFEHEGFTWVTKAIPGTARFMRRWYQIDHVFARGLGAVDEAPPTGCVDAAGISDHRAVWARLRITAPPGQP
jgi:endonuclease/exonuclease/phosphatase family metal-dependent hydrolase